MSRVEILQKMQLVIQEQMGKEDIVLTEDTKLDDLGVDSIELMEFIINLEDEFALEISDDTIDHMVKVAEISRANSSSKLIMNSISSIESTPKSSNLV